jgi:hypothetical protein
MTLQSTLVRLMRSASCAGLLCVCAMTAGATEITFAEAMQHYLNRQWPAAYGRFVALADRGDAEAARIAIMMLRYGTPWYGHSFGASQPQVDAWTRLAVQNMPQIVAVTGD